MSQRTREPSQRVVSPSPQVSIPSREWRMDVDARYQPYLQQTRPYCGVLVSRARCSRPPPMTRERWNSLRLGMGSHASEWSEQESDMPLCEKYGLATQRILGFSSDSGVIAESDGLGRLYVSRNTRAPLEEWSCKEGRLRVGLKSPERLHAGDWPAARANLLKRLKRSGFDAAQDRLKIEVGLHTLLADLEAGRAANEPLQKRLREFKAYEKAKAARSRRNDNHQAAKR